MNNFNLYLLVFSSIAITLFSSCQKSRKAEMVIINGTVYTADDGNPKTEAIAIENAKIIAIGKNDEIKSYIGDKTKVIDLEARFVYPGFIEGHAHIMGIGENQLNVDLLNTKSYDELIEVVAERAKSTTKGVWILGRGWHQDKWIKQPENMISGFPVHDELSRAVPDHPVFLKHASGHAALANAKAMEIAGINIKTKDPEGGEIFRTISESPTGIFNETAQRLILESIPEDTEERMRKVLNLAMDECLANGITSLHQAGSPKIHIDLFKSFRSSDSLSVRLYVMLSGRDETLLNEYFVNGPEVDTAHWLTIRSLKLYSDGALGSRGAWLLEEYSDAPDEFGHNVTPMKEIEEKTMRAAKAGFQVCTHAIGDRGNREVLDIYEKAIENFGLNDHRFRIEHAQHVSAEDIPRFAELNVIPAMQAIHMSSDRPWAIDRLGKERIEEGAYVWQKFLQQDSRIVNGTDAPVEPVSPLACFYSSVTRKTLKGTPEGGYEPDQKMTREQALESYTIDAAYGAFQEDVKGSIEVGKLADFTVLDKDIMTIPEEEILRTNVVMTIVGGKVLFRK
ncbi:MAG TPA: amidohydrolase [Cyclobacteriaceae bacterium]